VSDVSEAREEDADQKRAAARDRSPRLLNLHFGGVDHGNTDPRDPTSGDMNAMLDGPLRSERPLAGSGELRDGVIARPVRPTPSARPATTALSQRPSSTRTSARSAPDSGPAERRHAPASSEVPLTTALELVPVSSSNS
jgi:hypothetical protein